MYCPNCEFEIKQEVTECPICGGVLTEYPEEGADTNAASFGSEESSAAIKKPLDTCISNLILDAKHELDSLDSRPGTDPQPVKPSSTNLDFESLLSEETIEAGHPSADPFTAGPAGFNTMTDTPQADEEVFLLDDEPIWNDTASPFPETAVSPEIESPPGQKTPAESPFADDRLFIDEIPAQPESPFAEDRLFIDETPARPEHLFTDAGFSIDTTAARPFTPDTNLFIDEPSAQEPASPRNSEVSPPRQQPSGLPWSLQQDASETGSTAGMDFIPEAQPEKPIEALADAGDFTALKKTPSAAEAGERPPGSTGEGSKKRLVFIMLIGVLLIVGAYALNEYFLQDTTTARIEKPVPPRKSPRTAVIKPINPNTEAEPAAQMPATDTPAKAEPADVPSQNAQQQTPALEPPAPSAPKDIPTEKAAEKTGQESTIAPVKKAEPVAEPLTSTQKTPAVPDRKTSPAKGTYTIHVSSFKTQQYAQKQIEHLRDLGFDAYLETVDLGRRGIWHRVKVGHYATRAETEQAIKSIQKKHPGPTPLININR